MVNDAVHTESEGIAPVDGAMWPNITDTATAWPYGSCDDDNTLGGHDGCDRYCQREGGFTSVQGVGGTGKSTYTELCGPRGAAKGDE